MASRNVHKQDVTINTLPQDAIQEDRGLSTCGTPQLVLASTMDVVSYKNDRTAIAYKFDTMTIELEDSSGTITAAAGIAVSFPHQPDAVGFVIDWRQVTNGLGALAQDCYRVRVNWSLAGNSGLFYHGAYQLLDYSVFNAAGTVRLYVVLNDLVRKQGINYKDSGFAGTVRFDGIFGFMQPNYDTENNTHTDRTRNKIRIEAVRSYELRTSYLNRCATRVIDEDTLLAANQIYITDHNAANHDRYYDFPVILDEEESPNFDYPIGSIFAKITAKFLDKVAYHESKYDGNISGSENVILQLPTVVAACASASVTLDSAALATVTSGGTFDAKLVDKDDITIVPTSIIGGVIKVDTSGFCTGTAGLSSTGQVGDPYGSFWTLPTGKLNHFNHNWRWCGITGGYTDGIDYFDVNGSVTTRALAFPELLACDLRHVDCDGNFPMYGMGGISTTGYVIYSVVDAYNTAYSTASFLTGFRTPTINELDSCIYFPTQYTYSQKPFEKSQAQWWSETDATAGNKWIVTNTPVRTPVPNSGASGMSFPVRTTNISEL